MQGIKRRQRARTCILIYFIKNHSNLCERDIVNLRNYSKKEKENYKLAILIISVVLVLYTPALDNSNLSKPVRLARQTSLPVTLVQRDSVNYPFATNFQAITRGVSREEKVRVVPFIGSNETCSGTKGVAYALFK